MASLAMQSWSAALLLILASGAATAQERRASLVVVRDAQGAAVEGAEVVCFASPFFLDLDGEQDLLRAVTDASGRAVLDLLLGRRYSVFAAQVRGASFAASDVRGDLLAGAEAFVVLGEAKAQRSVRVTGDIAWFPEGPLTVQVSPVGAGQCFLDVGEDGVLPAIPAVAAFRVLDAHGQPLREGAPRKWGAAAAAAGSGDRTEYDLLLPLPEIVTMVVTDEAGRPVRDVELWQEVPPHLSAHGDPRDVPFVGGWRHLGCTGDSGRLSARLMVTREGRFLSEGVHIEARADGFTTARTGVHMAGQIVCNGAPMPVPKNGELPFVMREAQKLIIEPAAVYDVDLFGKPASIAPAEHSLRLKTAADGTAPLPWVRQRRAVRAARIRDGEGGDVWALVEQHGQCRVTFDPRRVSLRVLDRNGTPARNAVANLTWDAQWGSAFDIPLPVDARGVLRERVNAGAWFLWVRAGDDIGWRLIEEAESDIEGELRLSPIGTAGIRLVDGEQEPVAGERCLWSASTWWRQHDHAPLTRFVRRLQQDLVRDARGAQTSDADGMLYIPVLDVPDMSLDVDLQPGSWQWGSKVTLVVGAGDVEELRVRL